MAATGVAPISVALEGVHEPGKVPTPVLLAAMLRASEKVSDLIFSPGRPPQVEVFGQLVPVQMDVCTQNGQWDEMPSSFMPRDSKVSRISFAFLKPPFPSLSM